MTQTDNRWVSSLREWNRGRRLLRGSVNDSDSIGYWLPVARDFQLPVPVPVPVDDHLVSALIALARGETLELSISIPACGKAALPSRCLASLHRNPPAGAYGAYSGNDEQTGVSFHSLHASLAAARLRPIPYQKQGVHACQDLISVA